MMESRGLATTNRNDPGQPSRRVLLRPRMQSDADFLFRLRNDPDTCLWRRDRWPVSPEEHLQEEMNLEATFYHSRFIIARRESDEPLGMIFSYDHRPAMEVYFTLVLAKQARCRGLGPRASGEFIQWLFDTYPLEAVRATVYDYNESSLKILKRCGFLEEARLRRACFHGGRWHDRLIFGVLRSEWPALASRVARAVVQPGARP